MGMTVRAIHGDAAHLPDLLDGPVECIVTSPPYNAAMPYAGVSDVYSEREYRAKAFQWASAMHASLVRGGRLFLNVPVVSEVPNPDGSMSGRRWSPAHVWHDACVAVGLVFRDQIVWVKPLTRDTAWGSLLGAHGSSPSAPNYRGRHEAIGVWYRGPTWARRPTDPDSVPDVDVAAERALAGRGWQDLAQNVWEAQPAARRGHPAPMPARLVENCVLTATWPTETVCDPFMGSGTVLRVAHGLGRAAVGVDLSEAYVEGFGERGLQEVLV